MAAEGKGRSRWPAAIVRGARGELDRRRFLKLIAAGGAGAVLIGGCRTSQPPEAGPGEQPPWRTQIAEYANEYPPNYAHDQTRGFLAPNLELALLSYEVPDDPGAADGPPLRYQLEVSNGGNDTSFNTRLEVYEGPTHEEIAAGEDLPLGRFTATQRERIDLGPGEALTGGTSWSFALERGIVLLIVCYDPLLDPLGFHEVPYDVLLEAQDRALFVPYRFDRHALLAMGAQVEPATAARAGAARR